MKCPYCEQPAELVSGDVIYPHRPDLKAKNFYRCEPCNAYVGCHRGTKRPMGTLATPEMRSLRRQAHAMFDRLWESGGLSRKEAYSWLAAALGISKRECHIGNFNPDQCRAVIRAVNERRKEHA